MELTLFEIWQTMTNLVMRAEKAEASADALRKENAELKAELARGRRSEVGDQQERLRTDL